jgi:hypothetical protein
MSNLPLIELVRMSKDFFGNEWNNLTKADKVKWIEKYREVEKETNAMISKYDSREQWYMSGEGRLWTIDETYKGGEQ